MSYMQFVQDYLLYAWCDLYTVGLLAEEYVFATENFAVNASDYETCSCLAHDLGTWVQFNWEETGEGKRTTLRFIQDIGSTIKEVTAHGEDFLFSV
jgi:hypothetical protein